MTTDERIAKEDAERKVRDRRELVTGIVVFCFVAFVLFPFARWYAFLAATVVTYNYWQFVWEIVDERIDKRDIAWTGVARTAIAAGMIAISIALAYAK